MKDIRRSDGGHIKVLHSHYIMKCAHFDSAMARMMCIHLTQSIETQFARVSCIIEYLLLWVTTARLTGPYSQ